MKYRRLIYFVLPAILFVGSLNVIGLITVDRAKWPVQWLNNNEAGGNIILGSAGYVNDIRELAIKSGSQAALHRIMKDVDKYGYELDGNDYQNNLRLYREVGYLIYKIGYVDINTHYFRNKLNRAPKSLKELLELNQTPNPSRHWRLLSVRDSLYHLQGKNGIYNLKFISADGFCEAVYNKNGVLLTEKNDPVNMGTFNYAAGITGLNAHNKFDIDPYLKWGNSSDSPQKGNTQIMNGIKQAMEMYNMHSTSVMAYRARIMKPVKAIL